MKVLIVNKFLYPNGGSETYIFKLGEALKNKGHEVQYFGMEHPGRIVSNNVESYTSNMDFHGGKLGKLLYPFKIIYSLEARKKIRAVLDDMKPDVVHLNNINFQITPSIIYEIRAWEKKNSRRCKIVFTAHDYQWICPNHMMCRTDGTVCDACTGGKFSNCIRYSCIHGSKLRSILGAVEGYYYKMRKTYGLVDVIVAPSQFLYDRFAVNPLLKDKLVMMHNFLDVKEGVSESVEEKPYALYFGRFSVEKGVKTLLSVAKSLPDIKFVFAGSGPLEDEVNATANVVNYGFLTGDKLVSLIKGASFSIYPSEWYENCPFSVMESQMYRVPVVGSNIGGIPELISGGVLFEAGNEDELRAAISRLMTDVSALEELRAGCDSIVFDSVDEYTDRMLKIYA